VLVLDRAGRAAAAVTDDDGVYRVEDADPGWVRVRARPDLDTNRVGAYFEDQYFFCPATELRAADGVDGVDFELPGGGTIEGVVRAALGTPVSGVSVLARGLDFYNQYLARTAVSDAEGRFTIVGLDSIIVDGDPVPGLYSLSAAAPGAPPVHYGSRWSAEGAEPVPAGRGAITSIEFTLPAPTDVQGRILDDAGEPLPGAAVTFFVVGYGAVGVVLSDEAGEFTVPGVPGSEGRIRVAAAGFATRWGIDGDAEVDVPPLVIDGLGLVDVGDIALEPEAGLEVRVQGEGVGRARIRVRRSPDGASLGEGVVPEGLDDAAVRIGGLPPGPVFVEVLPTRESRSPAVVSETHRVVQGRALSLRIVLPLGGFVEGVVRRREGLPLRAARVEIVEFDGDESLLPIASVSTDGEGRFRLGPIGPGTAVVRAGWTPFCSGDPGRVAVFSSSGRALADRATERLEIVPGEVISLIDFALPLDRDRDEMDDVWELLWGLDPTRADATPDPDGDGVANLDEYRGRSDPLGAGAIGGDCAAEVSGRPAGVRGPIVLAVIAALRRRRAWT
jgi:hypothetical protein